MRKLLVSLGYQVPERDYSYQPISNTKSAVTEERVQETSSATLGEYAGLPSEDTAS